MPNTILPAHFNLLSLTDYPNYLDAVVDQQWQVWGYNSREDLLEFFAQEFSAALPRTWVLVDTNKNFPNDLVGAVTLSLDEMGQC